MNATAGITPNLLHLIGNTPLLRASHLRPRGGAEILLKLEGANASGSVKARAALNMILAARERGELPPGRAVVEPSSGNLGLALAMVCASLSIRCFLVVDPRMTEFSRSLMSRYGAVVETVRTPDENGSWQGSRLAAARRIANVEGALLLFQYSNPDNARSHEQWTAREILAQMPVAPDVCVVGVSTGGQLSGIAHGLRSSGAKTRMVGVDVNGSSIFGGRYSAYHLRGLGLSWWPGNLDPDAIHEVYRVDESFAFSAARFLARHEGILSGGSAGAVLSACIAEATKLGRDKAVVGVVAERGDRYLRQFFDNEWCVEHGIEIDEDFHHWFTQAQSLAPLGDWEAQADLERQRRAEAFG